MDRAKEMHKDKYGTELETVEENKNESSLNEEGDKDDCSTLLDDSRQKCGRLLFSKDLGNFHKVEARNGKLSCTCQSFMTWATCYEVKELGIILNRTYPDVQCAEASGENWDKVRKRLIKKRDELLMDNLSEEDEERIQGYFPEFDPQGPLIVETTTGSIGEEREQNEEFALICQQMDADDDITEEERAQDMEFAKICQQMNDDGEFW